VLRKWCNLRPERGFRCFVKDRQLVGLSQRDCTVHYPQLEADAPRIRTAIDEFLASRGRSKATKRTSGNSAGLTPGATAETVIPLSSSRCTEHAEDISTSEQPPTLLERLLDANAVLDVYVDAVGTCFSFTRRYELCQQLTKLLSRVCPFILFFFRLSKYGLWT